jgi:hypothetical protein
MDMVLCYILVVEDTRVNGKVISEISEATRDILMPIYIKESSRMEKRMVMEYKLGQMEKNMMVNGKWEQGRETVFGQE